MKMWTQSDGYKRLDKKEFCKEGYKFYYERIQTSLEKTL